MRRYEASCDCGWAGSYNSQAKADYALRRHSCARHIALAERARRARQRAAQVDRAPKPCLHKQARHQHGTHTAYVLDRCRCQPCAQAAAAYERRRYRESGYGRWQPYVSADEARQHVLDLMHAGVGLKRIAALTAVPQGSLWKLVYGRRGPDGVQRRSARIRRRTAEALLALQPTLDSLSDRAHVDGTGTRRRLQALAALGWSQVQLAQRIGVHSSNLTRITTGTRPVRAATARAVRDLYRELSERRPPERTRREKASAARARNHAKAQGWLVPAWWDDDTIDDPTAQPDSTRRPGRDPRDLDEVAVLRRMSGDRSVRLTAAERQQVVRRLLTAGWTKKEIEKKTGINVRRALLDDENCGAVA